jgi:uncharacterized membrane protein
LSSLYKTRNFLFDVMALQVVFTVAVVLNIPIIRQIVGFIYLTFVPGFIIIRILGLKKLDMTETLFFSVVIGIAFLMILGIVVNQTGPLFGVTRPLSLWPLIVSISCTVLASLLLNSYFSGTTYETPDSSDLPKYILFMSIAPVLSVVGAILVNAQITNLIYMIMIASVSILVIWNAFSKESSTSHALTLLCAYISLMLGSWLITNYITGWDEWAEFFSFTVTKNNGYWNLLQPISWNLGYLKYNAMASVTILPTIYSTIMNLDNTWVFKLVYPLLSSFMALGLYHLCRTQLDEKISYFATFFYLIVNVGLFGPMRQMIGQLFLIALLLILFDKRISGYIRNILFVVFGFGLVVSHYSLAYLFLAIIVILWIAGTLMSRSTRRVVTGEYVGVFAALTFMWYIYTEASGPMYGLLDVVRYVSTSFIQDFLNPSARGSLVLQGLGLAGATSLLHQIGSLLFQSTELLIVIGFLWVFLKRKTANIDSNYMYVMAISLAILVLNVAVPNLSSTFTVGRFYQVTLIALAPLCILGITTVTDYAGRLTHTRFDIKKLQACLILVILVSLLLFRTGLVYEVAKDSSDSLPLSLYRMDYTSYYGRTTNDQEVVGAEWLSKYYPPTSSTLIFADKLSIDSVLIGYGQITLDHDILIRNWTIPDIFSTVSRFGGNDKYIYLAKVNLEQNLIVGWLERPLNWTESTKAFSTQQDKVYSNGGCEIIKVRN